MAETTRELHELPVYHECERCGDRLPTRWNEPLCTACATEQPRVIAPEGDQ